MKNAAYLFSAWRRIARVLTGEDIYLFLDYDGTIAPIARTPCAAHIPSGTKNLLRRLAKTPDCNIAVVSGRALADITRRVGLKNIVYVGNHGCEIRGPQIRFTCRMQPRSRKVLERIKAELHEKLSGIRGILIEDKGFSLSVHYRCVGRKDMQKVQDVFYVVTALMRVTNSVRVHTGKMLLEVRSPVHWDKGTAARWLVQRQRAIAAKRGRDVLPIYVGDDVTDEDAFTALRREGITIAVGKNRETAARYYLRGVTDVARLLRMIADRRV